MNIIESRDTWYYRVLIKKRILLYYVEKKMVWGYTPELLSQGFELVSKHYERPCAPSEIEAAYKLEGTFTDYKGFIFEINNYFEQKEYMGKAQETSFTINSFFEYNGQHVLRLEFRDRSFTKVDTHSKYSYDKQRKKRISIFEYNRQRILRLEFGQNYNERIDLKVAHEDFRQWGEFYWLDVPDQEIQDIWQIRKPVEGFPMLGDEKVYIKKDGVWLPRKEYGSLIN